MICNLITKGRELVMTKERLLQTIQLYVKKGEKRSDFLRKVMAGYGENISYFPKVMPLYPELIKLHNNIVIASNVSFFMHDAIHVVLNRGGGGRRERIYPEAIGCVEIMDNVFVCANTTILYGVRIGKNVVIGVHSLVNKDIEANAVYAGIPVKRICSFEEFSKKRLNMETIGVEKSQHISKHEIEKPGRFLKITTWNRGLICQI